MPQDRLFPRDGSWADDYGMSEQFTTESWGDDAADEAAPATYADLAEARQAQAQQHDAWQRGVPVLRQRGAMEKLQRSAMAAFATTCCGLLSVVVDATARVIAVRPASHSFEVRLRDDVAVQMAHRFVATVTSVDASETMRAAIHFVETRVVPTAGRWHLSDVVMFCANFGSATHGTQPATAVDMCDAAWAAVLVGGQRQSRTTVVSRTRITSPSAPRKRRDYPVTTDDANLDCDNGRYHGSVLLVQSNVAASVQVRHGVGTYTWHTGQTYQGDWVNDEMQGDGRYTWPDGRTYVGVFAANMMHGIGTYDFGDGSKFEGPFRDDVIYGDGVYTMDTGVVYDVQWDDVDPMAAVFLAVDGVCAVARLVPTNAATDDGATRGSFDDGDDVVTLDSAGEVSPEDGDGLHATALAAITCVACLERRRAVAAVPCGHLCLCVGCAARQHPMKKCPMCRADVKSTLTIYF
jgi:hypothetical protein